MDIEPEGETGEERESGKEYVEVYGEKEKGYILTAKKAANLPRRGEGLVDTTSEVASAWQRESAPYGGNANLPFAKESESIHNFKVRLFTPTIGTFEVTFVTFSLG